MSLDATPAVSSSPSALDHQPQRLTRALGVFGGVLLALSCLTPASTLFVVVPPMLNQYGTWTPLILLIGGIVSLGVAFCYAELGTLVPSAGGEYSMIGKILGRPISWMVFALTATMTVIIPPILALGTGDYIASILPWAGDHRQLVGALVMLLATVCALLDIRSNALFTALFLGVEIVAAAVVAVLGFAHSTRASSVLVHAPHGGSPLSFGMLFGGLAAAMFVFNGFGSAVYLSEELKEPRRSVSKVVLWTLLAGFFVITLPTVAAVIGGRDLAHADFVSLVTAWGGKTVANVVSLAIAAAILNAVIVMVLQNARVFYVSGRDRAWPPAVNRALGRLHHKWNSPWLATLVVGVPGAVLAYGVKIESLLGVTGVVVAIVYAFVALAAFGSRRARHRGLDAWRMPLWPLAPVVVVASIVVAMKYQVARDLWVTGGLIVIGMIYYLVYLHRRAGAWELTTVEEE